MKKTLLPLAVLALSLSACDTTPKYTINGTVEGEQTGTAYLVTYAKQKLIHWQKEILQTENSPCPEM